jgi:hypothetical protein
MGGSNCRLVECYEYGEGNFSPHTEQKTLLRPILIARLPHIYPNQAGFLPSIFCGASAHIGRVLFHVLRLVKRS